MHDSVLQDYDNVLLQPLERSKLEELLEDELEPRKDFDASFQTEDSDVLQQSTWVLQSALQEAEDKWRRDNSTVANSGTDSGPLSDSDDGISSVFSSGQDTNQDNLSLYAYSIAARSSLITGEGRSIVDDASLYHDHSVSTATPPKDPMMDLSIPTTVYLDASMNTTQDDIVGTTLQVEFDADNESLYEEEESWQAPLLNCVTILHVLRSPILQVFRNHCKGTTTKHQHHSKKRSIWNSFCDWKKSSSKKKDRRKTNNLKGGWTSSRKTTASKSNVVEATTPERLAYRSERRASF